MKYKLKVYSIQEFGQRKDSQGKPHQEDSMFPEYGKQSENDRLFILCDGMGGHDAGEIASATVCEVMSRSILDDGHDEEGIFTSDDFSNALNAAFDALDEKDTGAEKKMGTTMTFLKLHTQGAFIAHMGDSRVYHIRPGKKGDDTHIMYETLDHSLINDLIKIKELTKEEARFSKQKNVITRAMQPNMERRPKAEIYETNDIKAGDYFYMCSDGMLEQPEMESGESLKNIFSEQGGSDENKLEILKSVTEKNRDNHTAFIIHILEVEDPIEETITEESSTLALDDKFAAIVEEDVDKKGAQSSSNTPIKKEGDIKKGEKIEKTTAVKKTLSMTVIRFLLAAIVVVAVIVGFNSFRSCSKEKNKTGKGKMELSSGKPSSHKASHSKPSRKGSDDSSGAASPAPSAQTAVDAANSHDASRMEASNQPSQNEPSVAGSVQIPVNNENQEGIVNSDQQLIRKIKR